MNIREAILSDVTALADLATQLGYPSNPEQMAVRLEMLAGRAGNGILVAEDESGVVGWLHVSGMYFLESPAFAEVLGLIVDKEHRGRSIGKQLLDGAVRWAAEHGYDRLRVRSNVIREDAHRFYEREGFRKIKTQVVLDRAL
ncbi:MAG TPA: GNAT family N-acetyltransferase [Thermoanaerobaculia bacterium]|jgi:GNAT superfamily N-acetyltransferase|nr:GNAT family N-acetyltransferase [Thermoanaerobaculia bacterium]